MRRFEKPTVYRKHGNNLVKHTFMLTEEDVRLLEEARSVYEAKHGFRVSNSIMIDLAIKSLHEEVANGTLRHHSDLFISE